VHGRQEGGGGLQAVGEERSAAAAAAAVVGAQLYRLGAEDWGSQQKKSQGLFDCCRTDVNCNRIHSQHGEGKKINICKLFINIFLFIYLFSMHFLVPLY
jgi:hypothetical protein